MAPRAPGMQLMKSAPEFLPAWTLSLTIAPAARRATRERRVYHRLSRLSGSMIAWTHTHTYTHASVNTHALIHSRKFTRARVNRCHQSTPHRVRCDDIKLAHASKAWTDQRRDAQIATQTDCTLEPSAGRDIVQMLLQINQQLYPFAYKHSGASICIIIVDTIVTSSLSQMSYHVCSPIFIVIHRILCHCYYVSCGIFVEFSTCR